MDDSLLMLGENSSVLVSEHLKKEGGSSVFNLIDGVLNVIVGKKGFQVHTPTAVSSARGTSFLIWVEKGKTNMAVTEGRVEFSNVNERVGEKLLIPAGKMSSIEEGKPPTSPVITPPEVVKVLYTKTLEEKERWGPVILSAKGSAIPPPIIVYSTHPKASSYHPPPDSKLALHRRPWACIIGCYYRKICSWKWRQGRTRYNN